MYIGEEMYRATTDREEAKRIFAHTVSRVEVETHSYCNRRCTYCPNLTGDRLGANQRIAPELWDMVLENLSEIDYARNIVLNYYNEPLADRAILDRIREARAAAPKARIMMYSNGDYLEPGLVDELADAGLSYLHISIHLKRHEEYTDVYVINRLTEISVRLGIAAQLKRIKSGEFARAIAPHKSMDIEIRGINFHQHGTNRGGLIEDITNTEKRSAPCVFPFAHFLVSYNGLIAPCCHIRADRPEHADYTYGSLRDYGSIFEAFLSSRAGAWRREMVHDREKRSPCDTCAGGKPFAKEDYPKLALAYRKHVVERGLADA